MIDSISRTTKNHNILSNRDKNTTTCSKKRLNLPEKPQKENPLKNMNNLIFSMV
jgi:hypothetical protein